MNLVKFAILALFLYILSLAAGYIIFKIRLHLILLSIIIFAALLILFIFLLAIILAIKKKPKIEEGSYKIERIKGKEGF